MKRYSIVACNNCKSAWVVDVVGKGDNKVIETTTCRKCGKRHKFKPMRKFKSVNDQEAAKLIRARVEAVINGYEEEFEEAFDEGLLEEQDWDENPQIGTKSLEDHFYELLRDHSEKEVLVNKCVERGFDESEVTEFISKARQDGGLVVDGTEVRKI